MRIILESGTRIALVAYCAHWQVWYDLRDAIIELRDVYLFPSKRRFIWGDFVLFSRIEVAYLDLDFATSEYELFKSTTGTLSR